MPIAVNLTVLKFTYGSVLQKEGEIPDGLYLIKSGQCKVGLTRTAEIKHLRKAKGKLDINENNEIFREFDPEGSLLNDIRDESLMKQNSRY